MLLNLRAEITSKSTSNRNSLSCGGVIDRTHEAPGDESNQCVQSDGAQWLCPGPWLHVPCALRSNPYMVSYVKRAHTPCPVVFLAFLTLPLWTHD